MTRSTDVAIAPMVNVFRMSRRGFAPCFCHFSELGSHRFAFGFPSQKQGQATVQFLPAFRGFNDFET